MGLPTPQTPRVPSPQHRVVRREAGTSLRPRDCPAPRSRLPPAFHLLHVPGKATAPAGTLTGLSRHSVWESASPEMEGRQPLFRDQAHSSPRTTGMRPVHAVTGQAHRNATRQRSAPIPAPLAPLPLTRASAPSFHHCKPSIRRGRGESQDWGMAPQLGLRSNSPGDGRDLSSREKPVMTLAVSHRPQMGNSS